MDVMGEGQRKNRDQKRKEAGTRVGHNSLPSLLINTTLISQICDQPAHKPLMPFIPWCLCPIHSWKLQQEVPLLVELLVWLLVRLLK